jgi:hypothetical protein
VADGGTTPRLAIQNWGRPGIRPALPGDWRDRLPGCEATKPPLKGYGWQCTGEDLLVVLLAGVTSPPMVVPRCLLRQYRAGMPDFPLPDPVPFVGGDHYHAIMPWARECP